MSSWFPITMLTAIVSPNALPNPRNIAASTPGPEARKITFFTVSHFVAPRESDASFKAIGTELNDSTHNEMIIGKTIIDKIKEAANKPNPELIVLPKNGAISSRIKGTNTRRAQSPKTTDGTPASTSMKGLMIFLNFFGAYSTI
jgi:hypothetical protein